MMECIRTTVELCQTSFVHASIGQIREGACTWDPCNDN